MRGFDKDVVGAASPEDAEAICAIYNAALRERSSSFETAPRSAADFAERIANPRFPLLVGDAGQGVLGWAGLTPTAPAPATRASASAASMSPPMRAARASARR